MRLPASNYLLDWTGQSVPPIGYGTRTAIRTGTAWRCPAALKLAPWAKRKTGQVLTSMVDEDGNPHFADPRHLVTKALEPLAELGLKPVVAIEYEFYLIDQKAAAEGRHQAGGLTGLGLAARPPPMSTAMTIWPIFSDLFAEIHEACAVQDIPAETFVAEYAPGQFEINILHTDDALKPATTPSCLNAASARSRASTALSPASWPSRSSSRPARACMSHVSLLDGDGNNVFAGPMDETIKPADQRHHAPCHRRRGRDPARSAWRSSPPTPIPTAG